ncbi:MAG TPA: hypothetical protein PK006_07770 [Saprospiraceae bacterium]|nr:hypothetical protein [Saprospiraceae bacterium]
MIDIEQIERFKSNYDLIVLAPKIETEDPNIAYYYDFQQSIQEYTSVFNQFDISWQWIELSLNNFKERIQALENDKSKTNIYLNLCDGDEVNGAPGISVIRYLDELNLIYTGADEKFYHNTTSKKTMKQLFDAMSVDSPKWMDVERNSPEQVIQYLHTPLILKPAVSGGSMGLTAKNVIHSLEEYQSIVNEINEGYRNWKLNVDGIIAEQYISGPEYTTLVIGSSHRPDEIYCYEPVERVFHKSLDSNEKFLSFDRLWETYETEAAMPDQGFFFEYHSIQDVQLNKKLKEISIDCFIKCEGQSYSRIDIRHDLQSNQLYILEANAQCGLSEDENYTSIGAILRVSKKSFAELILLIIFEALKHKPNYS